MISKAKKGDRVALAALYFEDEKAKWGKGVDEDTNDGSEEEMEEDEEDWETEEEWETDSEMRCTEETEGEGAKA